MFQLAKNRVARLYGEYDYSGKNGCRHASDLHDAGCEQPGEKLLRGAGWERKRKIPVISEQPVVEAPHNNDKRDHKYRDQQNEEDNCGQSVE